MHLLQDILHISLIVSTSDLKTHLNAIYQVKSYLAENRIKVGFLTHLNNENKKKGKIVIAVNNK